MGLNGTAVCGPESMLLMHYKSLCFKQKPWVYEIQCLDRIKIVFIAKILCVKSRESQQVCNIAYAYFWTNMHGSALFQAAKGLTQYKTGFKTLCITEFYAVIVYSF